MARISKGGPDVKEKRREPYAEAGSGQLKADLGNWAIGRLGNWGMRGAKRIEHSAWRKQQRLAGSGQIAAGRKQEPRALSKMSDSQNGRRVEESKGRRVWRKGTKRIGETENRRTGD